MSGHGNTSGNAPDTTTLGTLGWAGVVVLLAVVAILILTALGPVGAG